MGGEKIATVSWKVDSVLAKGLTQGPEATQSTGAWAPWAVSLDFKGNMA